MLLFVNRDGGGGRGPIGGSPKLVVPGMGAPMSSNGNVMGRRVNSLLSFSPPSPRVSRTAGRCRRGLLRGATFLDVAGVLGIRPKGCSVGGVGLFSAILTFFCRRGERRGSKWSDSGVGSLPVTPYRVRTTLA